MNISKYIYEKGKKLGIIILCYNGLFDGMIIIYILYLF